MTILSSGNVGIGTTSPSAKLHIESDAESTYFMGGATDSNNYYQLSISSTQGSGGASRPDAKHVLSIQRRGEYAFE